MHVVALDAYLAAGTIFLWAAAEPLYPRRRTLTFLSLNTPLFVALLTLYGLDVRVPLPYRTVIVSGAVVVIFSMFMAALGPSVSRAAWLIVPQMLIWGLAWISVAGQHYRDAAYLPLFVLYLTTAAMFQLSPPRRSLVKFCIVAGFTIWALVFLFHSWVTDRPQYADLAAEIWNMQKFLVTIGMLLVLLEVQVASNEWYGFHDQLTGLRRFFEGRLTEALQQSEQSETRIALIMIDLNGFKLINDSLGHEVGDRLLQHVGQSLRQVIRQQDVLARLAGDEFIIITVDLPLEPPATQIAEASRARVSEALRLPFHSGGHHLTVTGSVGIAIYPDDTSDEVLLRRLADQRMYEQKRQIPLKFEPTGTTAFITEG